MLVPPPGGGLFELPLLAVAQDIACCKLGSLCGGSREGDSGRAFVVCGMWALLWSG